MFVPSWGPMGRAGAVQEKEREQAKEGDKKGETEGRERTDKGKEER